jgi:hypothetical protein
MVYTSSVIETIAQCDALLLVTIDELNSLAARKTGTENQISDKANLVNIVPAQIEYLDGRIADKQALLATQTAESDKRNTLIEINALENKKMRFQNMLEGFHSLVLIDKQYELAKIEKRVEAATELKTMVEARKAELVASANGAG